jgi:hypothetical protein
MAGIMGDCITMWPHCVNVLIGIWLMAAPERLDLGNLPSLNEHIAGPLAAACAIISLAEVARGIRFLVLLIGIWLLAAPFLFGYWRTEPHAARNEIICGGFMAGIALVRGRVANQYGGGWKALWRRSED